MKQTHLFLFFSLIFLHGLTGQMEKKEVISSIEWEVNGQYRYFYEAPQFDKQLYDYPSIGIQPTYTVIWDVGYQSFIASAYFNWDRDENRRYWDLREFYYQKAKNNWELNLK